MKLRTTGEAGAAESSDIHVTVAPNEEQGLHIELTGKPVILRQFGRQIKELIKKTAEDLGVVHATISAKDNGALDYTIKARVHTAILRALAGDIHSPLK